MKQWAKDEQTKKWMNERTNDGPNGEMNECVSNK